MATQFLGKSGRNPFSCAKFRTRSCNQCRVCRCCWIHCCSSCCMRHLFVAAAVMDLFRHGVPGIPENSSNLPLHCGKRWIWGTFPFWEIQNTAKFLPLGAPDSASSFRSGQQVCLAEHPYVLGKIPHPSPSSQWIPISEAPLREVLPNVQFLAA